VLFLECARHMFAAHPAFRFQYAILHQTTLSDQVNTL
jgi:hypothetical protein